MSFSLQELLALKTGKPLPNASKDIRAVPEEKLSTLQKLNKIFMEKNVYSKSNIVSTRTGGASSSSSLSSSESQPRSTLAVLILTVDSLPHEGIWKKWIEKEREAVRGSSSQYFDAKVYIFAKHPKRISSPWVKQRLISRCMEEGKNELKPEWNSPEVIRAMLALLEEALDDKSCGRFIFLTESCMPIVSLKEAGERLFKEELSWLNAFHVPKNRYEEIHCFHKVSSHIIPNKCVWKCFPGWIALTRRHAEDIVELPKKVRADLVAAWGKGAFARNQSTNVWAPEEVYFPTLLAILGYLREDHADEIKRTSVNYARFRRHGDANPITFQRLDEKLLIEMRETDALFGRKFAAGAISVQLWEKMIFSGSDCKEEQLPKSEQVLQPLDTKKGESEKLEISGNETIHGMKRKQQEIYKGNNNNHIALEDDQNTTNDADNPLYEKNDGKRQKS